MKELSENAISKQEVKRKNKCEVKWNEKLFVLEKNEVMLSRFAGDSKLTSQNH